MPISAPSSTPNMRGAGGVFPSFGFGAIAPTRGAKGACPRKRLVADDEIFDGDRCEPGRVVDVEIQRDVCASSCLLFVVLFRLDGAWTVNGFCGGYPGEPFRSFLVPTKAVAPWNVDGDLPSRHAEASSVASHDGWTWHDYCQPPFAPPHLHHVFSLGSPLDSLPLP